MSSVYLVLVDFICSLLYRLSIEIIIPREKKSLACHQRRCRKSLATFIPINLPSLDLHMKYVEKIDLHVDQLLTVSTVNWLFLMRSRYSSFQCLFSFSSACHISPSVNQIDWKSTLILAFSLNIKCVDRMLSACNISPRKFFFWPVKTTKKYTKCLHQAKKLHKWKRKRNEIRSVLHK